MEDTIERVRCAAALRTIMQYRKVTMAKLSSGTGLSYRTIEGYYYGRNSLPTSKAYNVIEIEHFLDVDGRILTGSKSIEQFFKQESEIIKSESRKSDPGSHSMGWYTPGSYSPFSEADMKMERLNNAKKAGLNALRSVRNAARDGVKKIRGRKTKVVRKVDASK